MPIEGAQVYFKDYPNLKALTKSDGAFDLQANREWFLMPIIGPFDFAPVDGTLIIVSDGFEQLEIEETWGAAQLELPQKEIELEKLK